MENTERQRETECFHNQTYHICIEIIIDKKIELQQELYCIKQSSFSNLIYRAVTGWGGEIMMTFFVSSLKVVVYIHQAKTKTTKTVRFIHYLFVCSRCGMKRNKNIQGYGIFSM